MPEYAKNMPRICQKYAKNMRKYAKNMPKYAKNMPKKFRSKIAEIFGDELSFTWNLWKIKLAIATASEHDIVLCVSNVIVWFPFK